MGALLVILSAFGFSTLGIFGKFAYQAGFTRNQALFWRFTLSLPILFLVLALMKALPNFKDQARRRIFLSAMGIGAIGIGVEATLYFMTLEHLGAALTGIFLYLYPAVTAMLAHFFLNEKMSGKKWACVMLALLGCVFTVDPTSSTLKDTVGVVIGIVMGSWYAVYLIFGNRVMKNENPLTVSTGVVLGAALAFGGLTLLEIREGASFHLPPLKEWWPIAGLALIASALPFTTLYAGMKRVGAVRASVLSTLELVFTIVFAAALLGEKLTLIQVAGAVLILISVLLIQKVR